MKKLFIPNWNGHLYLQEEDDVSVVKIYDHEEIKDKKLLSIKKNDILGTNKLIEESIRKSDCKLAITGDHSNTYSLFKAVSSKLNNKKNMSLVIFDAHPDVEVSTEVVSHEDYLRNLIEDDLVKSENVYLFGIRTFSRKEFEYLQEKKINYYTISDVLKSKNKMIDILKKINGSVYLSIDIDVLDPDEAPGTYYKEWCGLYLDELKVFISELFKSQNSEVLFTDITEFYSKKDEDEITEKNIVDLIKFLDELK